MIDLQQIETKVRAQPGSWHTYFRREGAEWQCIVLPEYRLNEQDYQTLVRRLSTPEPRELTPAERKRNSIRALADKADHYGR